MSSPTNTRIIARNSFWNGLEIAMGIVTALGTSIPMARIIGPERLGYFNYIMWLANMSGMIGSLGLPATTSKYMAEYLGRGEEGVARAIFFATLRIQTLLALLVTLAGLILVFTVSDPAYYLISAFLVASVFLGMATFVPSQANMAREDMKANFTGSFTGSVVYILAVTISLALGWDLIGITIGTFVSRAVELAIKTTQVLRWINRLPRTALPESLRLKMRSFSGQSMILMLLNVVVWNRSDVVFLKMLTLDIRQLTFYSIAFNLMEKTLTLPQIFGQAIGASILAQYGRDQSRLSQMAAAAGRYMFLLGAPLLLGMAALSGPLVRLLYGSQYLPVIPALAVAAVLAVPRTMLMPAQQLLQASERQNFLIWFTCLCGLVNIALDLALIPGFASVGAIVANGTAQALATIGIWVYAVRLFRIPLQRTGLAKIAISSAVMAAAVAAVALSLPPVAGLAVGLVMGLALFPALLALTKALGQEDRDRILLVGAMAPAAMRRWLKNSY